MLTLITENPMTSTQWQNAMGCGKSTFNKIKNDLLRKGKVVENEQTKKWEMTVERDTQLQK